MKKQGKITMDMSTGYQNGKAGLRSLLRITAYTSLTVGHNNTDIKYICTVTKSHLSLNKMYRICSRVIICKKNCLTCNRNLNMNTMARSCSKNPGLQPLQAS